MVVEIISLCVALVAVIVGPIVSYKITKKNMEFQFRTLTQEKWIDKLEKATLDFMTSCVAWIEKYPAIKEKSEIELENIIEFNNQIDTMLDSINSSIIKIHILLDENKFDQKSILEKIFKMKSIINSKDFSGETIAILRELHVEIFNELKIIFSAERKKIAKIYK